MKDKTDDDIKQFFNDLFNGNPDELTVTREGTTLKVKVDQMYEYVPVDFKILSSIGAFFGTDKVNGSDKDYYRGCNTCDYGSSYVVTFVIDEQ